jgi:hypothetical protein
LLGSRTELRKEKGWAYSSPAKEPEEYLEKCPTKTWLRAAAAAAVAHAGAGENEEEEEEAKPWRRSGKRRGPGLYANFHGPRADLDAVLF